MGISVVFVGFVDRDIGTDVGLPVDIDGFIVVIVGDIVGIPVFVNFVGFIDGNWVGSCVGFVGFIVGFIDGFIVGDRVGIFVNLVGFIVGYIDGIIVGDVGLLVGNAVGIKLDPILISCSLDISPISSPWLFVFPNASCPYALLPKHLTLFSVEITHVW